MIYVDRQRIDPPVSLSSGSESEKEINEAKKLYHDPHHLQKKYRFKAYLNDDVRQTAALLFNKKCAYCETPLHLSLSGSLEHFRPKDSIAEVAGSKGYWWLANTWQNIVLACEQCNAYKANRFPIENEHLRALSPGQEVNEQPLLLDPTNDYPGHHLIFDENGNVSSLSPQGLRTISVLNLNRMELVISRRKELFKFFKLVSYLEHRISQINFSQINNEFVELLSELTSSSSPFAAIKRQFAKGFIMKRMNNELQHQLFPWFKETKEVKDFEIKSSKIEYRRSSKIQSQYSLDNTTGHIISRSVRRTIEKITIVNFKGITQLDINVQPNWLMLLGENGAGKSSVLQATSLCLAGAASFKNILDKHEINPIDFIGQGASQAKITVKLTGFDEPHQLVIHSKKATFIRPGNKSADVFYDNTLSTLTGDDIAQGQQFIMLGYGATRLLPHKAADSVPYSYIRIDNLFNPGFTLIAAENWLLSLNDTLFEQSAFIIKQLLSLSDDTLILKSGPKVIIQYDERSVPLSAHSDGYKAVIALSVDICEVSIRLWGDPGIAEGIVFIDEIDCHLHPTWKMRITNALRKAFPGMQFITTSHDPLCLRGLAKGEVCVLKSTADRQINVIQDLPDPSDLSIEQLLTSPFFGLNTTDDPEHEALFDEYYALMALPEPRNEDLVRLQELKSALSQRRFMGGTPREQLLYEAVDKVLAEHKLSGNPKIFDMKDEASSAIAQIWDDVLEETFKEDDQDK